MKGCRWHTLECFFANITGGKSATIIAFNATILQNIFQNILYLQHENCRVMLKKEMPITIPFLYSMQTSVQTLYTLMNTSYQFSDLITTIVSNN